MLVLKHHALLFLLLDCSIFSLGTPEQPRMAIWFNDLNSAMPKLAEETVDLFKKSKLNRIKNLEMKCFKRLDKKVVESADTASRKYDILLIVGPSSLSEEDFDNFVTKTNDNVIIAIVGESAKKGNAYQAAKLTGRIFILCGDVSTLARQALTASMMYLQDQKIDLKKRNLQCNQAESDEKFFSKSNGTDFSPDVVGNCDRELLRTKLLPRSSKKSTGPNTQKLTPELFAAHGDPEKNLERGELRHLDKFDPKESDKHLNVPVPADDRSHGRGIPSKDLEFSEIQPNPKSEFADTTKLRSKKKSWMDFAPLAQDSISLQNERVRAKERHKQKLKLSGYVKTFQSMITRHEMKKRLLQAFSPEERQLLAEAYGKMSAIRKQEAVISMLQGANVSSASNGTSESETNPSIFSNTTVALAMILSQLAEIESSEDIIRDQTSILAIFSPNELKVLHKLAQKSLGDAGTVNAEIFQQLKMLDLALASIDSSGNILLQKRKQTPVTATVAPAPKPKPKANNASLDFPSAAAVKQKSKKSSSKGSKTTGAIIGVGLAGIVVAVAFAVFVKKQKRENEEKTAIFTSIDNFFPESYGPERPDPETFLPGGTGHTKSGSQEDFFADLDRRVEKEQKRQSRSSTRSEVKQKIGKQITKMRQKAKEMKDNYWSGEGEDLKGYISWERAADFVGKGILKKTKKAKKSKTPSPKRSASSKRKTSSGKSKTNVEGSNEQSAASPSSEKSTVDRSQKSETSKSRKSAPSNKHLYQ